MVVCRFFILTLLLLGIASQRPTVQYYEKLIKEFLKASSEWEQPTDSRKFFYVADENETATFYGQYDFIIVGAGPAGSVLANRLTESGKFKVLLLEAGGEENDFTDVPGFQPHLLKSNFNWGYKTVPQKNACLDKPNRQCNYARGKVLGGSSVINQLWYVRGNKQDFDDWGKTNPGWSYKDVLPYFKKSERSTVILEEPEYHGHHGPLSTETVRYRPEIAKVFLSAGLETGRKILDYNGKNETGFSPQQLMTNRGKRCSAAKAYIKPAKNRRNLKILDQSLAVKILIENKKAYGVEFIRNHKRYQAKSSKEVIISGGSINSPQILMLSGIGPKDQLRDLQIPLVQDSPVGEHLTDHQAFIELRFDTNTSTNLTPLDRQIRDFINGYGILTTTSYISGLGFASPRVRSSYPTVEYGFYATPTDVRNNSENLPNQPAVRFIWTMITLLFHRKSEGTLKLKTNDPLDFPLIDPNFYSDEDDDDMKEMLATIKDVLKISETSAFKSIGSKLLEPSLPACSNYENLSDDYWKCVLKQTTSSGYHAVATCKMGPKDDNTTVVDNKLKVYGIESLRVADASVIPFNFASDPVACVYMIGEKGADIIRKEYGDL